MQFSNYPAGVTDAHPEFNPPEEMQVICGAEEMELVPSYWVKAKLLELQQFVKAAEASPSGARWESVAKTAEKVQEFLDAVYAMEDNGAFDCPYEGEVQPELDGGAANWDCPVCGNANQTILEDDEPDYDAMREARDE